MIKKVALLMGLCVCFSTPALAADSPYVSVNLGITMPTDSDISEIGGPGTGTMTSDTGFAIGAAIGQKIGMGRVEAELGYKKADLKKVTIDGVGSASINGDASVLSLMANGYIDFNDRASIKPYVMAGLGVARMTVKSSDIDADDSDNVFAYQVGAGLGVPLNENVTLDVSYRYMGTSDAEFNNLTRATYGSHNLLAGLRLNF